MVLSAYSDWLFERREFHQAASGMHPRTLKDLTDLQTSIAFADATALPKAMVAHEKALQRQSLFDISAVLSDENLFATGYSVAGS